MRRRLLWSLIAITALVLALALVVNLRVDDASGLPAPEATLPIQMPDGDFVPLADLLASFRAAQDAPHEPQPLVVDEAGRARAAPEQAAALYPGMPWGPAFKLAEHHRQAGRLDQALALFQSIAPSDPDYARSRRRIAQEILARGRPLSAVPYVNASLLREPLDMNSWQVLVEVYGAGLGLDTADR